MLCININNKTYFAPFGTLECVAPSTDLEQVWRPAVPHGDGQMQMGEKCFASAIVGGFSQRVQLEYHHGITSQKPFMVLIVCPS